MVYMWVCLCPSPSPAFSVYVHHFTANLGGSARNSEIVQAISAVRHSAFIYWIGARYSSYCCLFRRSASINNNSANVSNHTVRNVNALFLKLDALYLNITRCIWIACTPPNYQCTMPYCWNWSHYHRISCTMSIIGRKMVYKCLVILSLFYTSWYVFRDA